MRGFFAIILAIGLVSALGVMSLTLGLFANLKNRKAIEHLNRKEAYYSSEIAAWHELLRNESGFSSITQAPILITSALEGEPPSGLVPDDFNAESHASGTSLNYLTTKSYASHLTIIRRYTAGSIGHWSKGSGYCGATTFKGSKNQYNVCLMPPAGPPKGSCVAGKTLIDISGKVDEIRSLAIAPDGKINAGGTSVDPDHTDRVRWVVARFNSDRTLDKTFNGVGYSIVTFEKTAKLNAIALQSDGKIVAVGATVGSDDGYYWAIGRFLPSGSLDSSFDGDGLKIIDPSGVDAEALAVALQTINGTERILIGGTAPPSKFALTRLNPDGSIDTEFNGGNRVEGDEPERLGVIRIIDGQIRVGGLHMIAQYQANGQIHETFGLSGRANLPNTLPHHYRALDFFKTDSQFFALGYAMTTADNNFKGYFLSARYSNSGGLDTSYGESGAVYMVEAAASGDGTPQTTTSLPISVQGDKILTLFSSNKLTGTVNFNARRYNTAGQIDSTFGTGGESSVPMGTGMGFGFLYSMAVFPSGSFVAGGSYMGSSAPTGDLALVCFNPDGK